MECHSHDVQQTEFTLEELQSMTLDPTLDQCCRRDIESQIKNERIRHSLQQQDRIDARQRLLASAICRNADSLADLPSGSQSAHGSGNQQSSQVEQELQELRRQRLQQLQAQSAERQQQQQEGFGRLNIVQEENLLKLLSDPPGQGLLVVYLATSGHEPCSPLDQYLEAAAAQYRSTYFARSLVSRKTRLISRLQLPQGVPALLVCKDGVVVGKASTAQFGQHELHEDEVLAYLSRFRVLSARTRSSHTQQRTAAAAQPGYDVSDSSDFDDSDSEGNQVDNSSLSACEVCGRGYPHTHIKAMYATNQLSQDEDNTASDSGED